jgi:hypothetical protein
MKKKMKNLYLLIACLLLLSCESEPEATACTWDFPAKPGTEEWLNLHGTQERIDTCQIPKDKLSCLSTGDLTTICLNYPFLSTYIAFSDWRYGLDVQFENFNGLRELFKRNQHEVAEELLKRFRSKVLLIDEISLYEGKEDYFFTVMDMEVLFSRCQSQEKEILQWLVAWYEKMLLYPDYFDGFLLRPNFFARAFMIIKLSPESLERIPHGYNNSVFYGDGANEETAEIINELSYELIK